MSVAAVSAKSKPYPAYKPSGVDWLGGIPAHWQVKRLKYVAMLNPDILAEETDSDCVLSYVDITNVDSRGVIISPQDLRFEDAPSRARRKVQHGDTVLSTVRTYLKAIAYVEHPPDNLIVSTGFAVLRPGPEWHARFLYRLVQSHGFVETVVAHSEGVGYPAINPGELASLRVWLPPSSEQQAIAAFLDRETEKIDALVARKERLIALLREKRAALITHAVTKGLNSSAPMKPSGVEWLGDVPEHWDVKPLRHVGDAIIGLTYDPADVVDEGDGILVLRASNVSGGRIVFDDNVFVRTKIPERLITRVGDILICSRSGSRALVGKNAKIDRDSAGLTFGTFMTVFRSVCNDYLFYVFNSTLFDYQSAAFLTSTINQLTVGSLHSFETPTPPRGEQSAIANFLDHETAKIDALIAKVREHMERLREYRAGVISAAVTGKIDVRGEVA